MFPGNAQVLEIANCPPIAANPGPGFQIVTGTFRHEAAQTLDISVEDELKPIGTTPNHPIWSADRQAFVRADSLTVGERLQTLNGTTVITSITARGPPEPVYNLEVQVKHTYFVADSGVLVHNGKTCNLPVIDSSFTPKPTTLGRVGETLAGIGGRKTKISINGQNRIPDSLTATKLTEVKNVAKLSYTRQLRDFSDYAKTNGLRYELFVRGSTKLSSTLLEKIRKGEIILKYIPGIQ
ncbi:putative toxin [Gimesia maris]|uniref:Tox-REase-7 domain-containing protein n=1 Tax=Gimesia maris TaxID=122 RepID=A0ABX5YJB5_9PLAN|nr:putative toxin [Gimesia maris]EDL59893.1 hypothetical protein PM8797T_16078 [Gimesia maris DSM 8797]QEG15709.1 hypothetical protein GmarT_15520 [Gimesia maris]QGQ31010.1 hypothetical protein F1729_21550 [Gimesia maris]